ncbi:hypothetical protein Tco_1121080 [Tanacetum coccineum]|uniref:Reverse transcriptase/retrotransposon-derived protein RNase H-like domain-containing protein n=1 Tax=Tanacetum coccineum TaxID=301880 RepID=A0ABQ5IWP5_9ASTR
MTHHHPKGSFVPQAVLTRSDKLSTSGAEVNTVRPVNTTNTKAVNTVRPVNTTASKPIVNHPRPKTNAFKRGYSQSSRPFNRYYANKNSIVNTNVNTARVKHTTARDRAVVSENKGKGANAIKASACWIQVYNGLDPQKSLILLFYVPDLQQKEYKEKAVIDSGCSRNMTGNKCYLDEYEDYDGGFVSFGDGKGRISGKVFLLWFPGGSICYCRWFASWLGFIGLNMSKDSNDKKIDSIRLLNMHSREKDVALNPAASVYLMLLVDWLMLLHIVYAASLLISGAQQLSATRHGRVRLVDVRPTWNLSHRIDKDDTWRDNLGSWYYRNLHTSYCRDVIAKCPFQYLYANEEFTRGNSTIAVYDDKLYLTSEYGAKPRDFGTSLTKKLVSVVQSSINNKPQGRQMSTEETLYLIDAVSVSEVLEDSCCHAKIEAVKNWASPTTPTEIRQFLGLARLLSEIYQRFLKDCKKLCEAPILALPEGNDDFVVYCDASHQGIVGGGIRTLSKLRKVHGLVNMSATYATNLEIVTGC